jgi:hypothetical protein
MRYSKQFRQRGGSKMNFLLMVVVLGAMAFVAIKVIPPYFANYQFQDAIETESRFALSGYPKRSQDDIQDEVYRKAQDLGIPAKRDDVHVMIANNQVSISLDYTIPIDLNFYQFVLQFHPHADNHTI